MTRSPLLLVFLLALSILLAGCASDSDSSTTPKATGGGTDDTGAQTGENLPADLRFELEEIGGKSGGPGIPVPTRARCGKSSPATCSGELACPAATDADATTRELCDWLARSGRAALQPAEEGRACTMIYGGPETAHVTGTFDGTEISVRYSRQNGCEIARWEAIQPLWTGEVDSGRSTQRPERELTTDPR